MPTVITVRARAGETVEIPRRLDAAPRNTVLTRATRAAARRAFQEYIEMLADRRDAEAGKGARCRRS